MAANAQSQVEPRLFGLHDSEYRFVRSDLLNHIILPKAHISTCLTSIETLSHIFCVVDKDLQASFRRLRGNEQIRLDWRNEGHTLYLEHTSVNRKRVRWTGLTR